MSRMAWRTFARRPMSQLSRMIESSTRARLVVVGRHGQGGFLHELIAPKAVQVAHHAKCSVAVVPDEWNGDGHGVIVGVDGSAPAALGLPIVRCTLGRYGGAAPEATVKDQE